MSKSEQIARFQLIRDGATLVQNVADVIECVCRQPAVRMPPTQFERTDSMRQTIDQTVVDRCRQKLAKDLSLNPVDIDEFYAATRCRHRLSGQLFWNWKSPAS
jgi:predicted Rossmann fold nucleotide-binding protein DprA/Smf involved in DNA uptake